MEKVDQTLNALNKNAAALQAIAMFLLLPILLVLVLVAVNGSKERAAWDVRREAVAAGHATVTEGDFRWLPSVYEYEKKVATMEDLVAASKAYIEDLETHTANTEERMKVLAGDLRDALQDTVEVSEALAVANEEILRLETEVAKREAVDTLETVSIAEVIEADLKELEEAEGEQAVEPADREEEANESPQRKKKWFEFWKKRR